MTMLIRFRSSFANESTHAAVEVGELVSGPAIRLLPTTAAQASQSGLYCGYPYPDGRKPLLTQEFGSLPHSAAASRGPRIENMLFAWSAPRAASHRPTLMPTSAFQPV